MEALIVCMECQALDGQPNLSSMRVARIPDDGLIEQTCNRGHKTLTIIQQVKFELLSQMAIQAIVDNYYRDAIASFTAALERLYEFYTAAVCLKHGVAPTAFGAAWKSLARQSERQLGAFVAAHLLDTGQGPQLMRPKQIELRNDVVHKGRLATRDEAVSYGEAAVGCAQPILDLLQKPALIASTRTLVGEHLQDRFDVARRAGVRPATYALSTYFSLTNPSPIADVETAIASCAAKPDFNEGVKQANALGAIHDLFRELAATSKRAKRQRPKCDRRRLPTAQADLAGAPASWS